MNTVLRDVRRPYSRLIPAVALLLVAGCEGPPSVDTSNTEATVKGVVKIDGTPAKGGEIVFDPTNIGRQNAIPRKAPIGPDGTFTAKTLTGSNTIRLEGEVARKNPSLQGITRGLDVKAGENTFNFEVNAVK